MFSLTQKRNYEGNIGKNAIKVEVVKLTYIFYGENWFYKNAIILWTAGWIWINFCILENWHSRLQFFYWHKQGITNGTLRKTQSKLKWNNFTKMRISSERLDGFWWTLAFWKTDILGYNVFIDTKKKLWREHWEKRDQSWGCKTYIHFLWGELILQKCNYLVNGWMDLDKLLHFGKLTF